MEVHEAQEPIEGTVVARMIIEFWAALGEQYHPEVLTSSLCAVGPLQSMIGLAIKNGHLALPQRKADDEAHARFHAQLNPTT